MAPMQRHQTSLSRRNDDGRKRTTNGPQTGDQVRPPADENGKKPDCIEDQQEEKVKLPSALGVGGHIRRRAYDIHD